MRECLNWTVSVVEQQGYLNRKPSEKNTRVTTIDYCGMTREEVIADLEKRKVVPYGIKCRIVSYREPFPRG